jgi:hypothetical protein
MLMALGIHPASALRWLAQAINGAQTQALAASEPVPRYPDDLPSPPQNRAAAATRPGAPRTGFGKR